MDDAREAFVWFSVTLMVNEPPSLFFDTVSQSLFAVLQVHVQLLETFISWLPKDPLNVMEVLSGVA
jgi:hypothetical protein